jgi:hypothetical protein
MKNIAIAICFIVFGLAAALNSIAGRNPQVKYSMWRLLGGVIGGVALIGWDVYLLLA